MLNNNDSLFIVIRWLLNRVLPEKFNTAEKMKNALKLKRDDPVSIKHIPSIEKMYKVNINITGDDTYETSGKFNRTIEFEIEDKIYRYTVDQHKRKVLHKKYHYSPKIMNAYFISDGIVRIYTGEEEISMDYPAFKTFKEKYRDDRIFLQCKTHDVKKEFNQYKSDAKAIFKASDKDINLFKSTEMHVQAKALFYQLSNSTMSPEAIRGDEAEFLVGHAALIKAIKGEFENVWYYDVNTMYGSLLVRNMYPMKEGEFVTLKKLPEKLEYGLYLCEVIPSEDEKINLLFRYVDDNKYTHYDIMSARLLGLKIKLIKCKNNALIYTKDKLEYGQRLFKPTIDYLYDLKTRLTGSACSRVKAIISSLWGSLCERTEKKFTIAMDEEFECPEHMDIKSIFPIGNKLRITCVYEDGGQYATDYARIGVFLTSQSRYFMTRTCFPHLDSIVRIHTDSILSTKEIPELKLSNKLGEWKLEKYSHATILNNNSKPVFQK